MGSLKQLVPWITQVKTFKVKMPSTPQMRKANEKNAKNVTKRGNVVKSSKTDEKYPVSPELIVSLEFFEYFHFSQFFSIIILCSELFVSLEFLSISLFLSFSINLT